METYIGVGTGLLQWGLDGSRGWGVGVCGGGGGLKFHCALHTLNPSLLSFPFHFMVVKMNMHTYIQTPSHFSLV